MSGRARLLLLIAVVTLVYPRVVWAQAEERSVHARVLDRVGTPVTTLTAADFVVREDGVEREVLRVTPATDPLRIAVLIDTSQAIRPHVNDLRTSLRQFVADMHGKNAIALYEFGERPRLIVDYTRERARLEAGIGRVFDHPGSGAHLLDAIIDVSRDARKREGARTAIVVISAEGPEFSNRYYLTVLDELREADASLDALVLSRRRGSVRNQAAIERERTLVEGARMTGGRQDFLLTSMALTDRLRQLASELDNEYHVVYARPVALIAPERIDVDVRRPGLMVRAPQVLPRHSGREAVRPR